MKIKGDGDWEYWNPHMGDASKVTPKTETAWDTEYSVFDLNFEPGKAVFISRKAQEQIQ